MNRYIERNNVLNICFLLILQLFVCTYGFCNPFARYVFEVKECKVLECLREYRQKIQSELENMSAEDRSKLSILIRMQGVDILLAQPSPSEGKLTDIFRNYSEIFDRNDISQSDLESELQRLSEIVKTTQHLDALFILSQLNKELGMQMFRDRHGIALDHYEKVRQSLKTMKNQLQSTASRILDLEIEKQVSEAVSGSSFDVGQNKSKSIHELQKLQVKLLEIRKDIDNTLSKYHTIFEKNRKATAQEQITKCSQTEVYPSILRLAGQFQTICAEVNGECGSCYGWEKTHLLTPLKEGDEQVPMCNACQAGWIVQELGKIKTKQQLVFDPFSFTDDPQQPSKQLQMLKNAYLEKILKEKFDGWHTCSGENCFFGKILLPGEGNMFECGVCAKRGCLKCGRSENHESCKAFLAALEDITDTGDCVLNQCPHCGAPAVHDGEECDLVVCAKCAKQFEMIPPTPDQLKNKEIPVGTTGGQHTYKIKKYLEQNKR